MTELRALNINKGINWDISKSALLKTIFDGLNRFQWSIIIGDRFPIEENKLIEFVQVIKKHFSPENADMVKSLGIVTEKGLFRPDEITPTKTKTSESFKYCVVNVKDCVAVGWPNYRYLIITDGKKKITITLWSN